MKENQKSQSRKRKFLNKLFYTLPGQLSLSLLMPHFNTATTTTTTTVAVATTLLQQHNQK